MLLSLVLITIYFREPANGGLHGVQSGGATVLRPFEVAANRVASPFRDAYGWFSGLVHAKSENADLRAKLDRLRAQVIQNSDRRRRERRPQAPAALHPLARLPAGLCPGHG